ncbi:transposase [Fulvivirgaceae bacterium LMO-SS25]
MGGEMVLSDIGKIAQKYWNEIPNYFSFVTLDSFVIMPNHVHGILIIDKSDQIANSGEMGNIDRCRDAINRVSTELQSTTKPKLAIKSESKTIGGISGSKNPMLHDNIPRIIRWYKGRCTFEIRKMKSPFAWQPRYHDHLIRNNAEFQRISDYIKTNPENWKKDKFYSV